MFAFTVALAFLTAIGVREVQLRLEKWSYEGHLED